MKNISQYLKRRWHVILALMLTAAGMALAVFRYDQHWVNERAQQIIQSQEPRRLSWMELKREARIHNQRGSETMSDAHYIAGDPGFYNYDAWKHEYSWNTNTGRFWDGVWREGANGLRVQLFLGGTNTPDGLVAVYVGSIVKHAEDLYYTPPDGKFAKFELLDTNGVPVPFKGNTAYALYDSHASTFGTAISTKPGWLAQRLSELMPSLEGHFPDTISDRVYPSFRDGNENPNAFDFYSNGPPHQIAEFTFNKLYSIKAEGDYQLTVRPVIYQHGSKPGILERVDLPSVTTMVHLMPPAKP